MVVSGPFAWSRVVLLKPYSPVEFKEKTPSARGTSFCDAGSA